MGTRVLAPLCPARPWWSEPKGQSLVPLRSRRDQARRRVWTGWRVWGPSIPQPVGWAQFLSAASAPRCL